MLVYSAFALFGWKPHNFAHQGPYLAVISISAMDSQLHNLETIFRLLDELYDEEQDADWRALGGQSKNALDGYGHLYQLPYGQVGAVLFLALGLRDDVDVANKSADPQAAILELSDHQLSLDDIVPELAPAIPSLLIVTMNNLKSLSLFHVAMPDLIKKVVSGDDDALFEAVWIDPSSMQTDAIASRISTAFFQDDRSFFDRLAKALTRTKPTRPKPHLDQARLLMAVLDESGDLSQMTNAELTTWAVERLGIYPGTGDPLSAIRDQRRKRKGVKGD